MHAPPHTIGLLGAPNAINAALYDNLNFKVIRDIVPVAGIVRAPNVKVVNPSFPARTVPDFIAYAQADPGKLNMGSSGNGSTPHVGGELFKMMTGVNMQRAVQINHRVRLCGPRDHLIGGGWCGLGGMVPLGYVSRDKKVVVADEEAERFRIIFRRYLDLGSIGLLLSVCPRTY